MLREALHRQLAPPPANHLPAPALGETLGQGTGGPPRPSIVWVLAAVTVPCLFVVAALCVFFNSRLAGQSGYDPLLQP